MDGTLLKKTTGGQWHSRQFTLVGSNLTWLKSDNKTTITVDIRGAEIRDIKVGPKKFSFEIIVPGDTIVVAASGEAEKSAWMAALKLAMGKREEAEGILQKAGAGRASVRTPIKPIVPVTTPTKPGVAPPAVSSPPSPVKPVGSLATSSPIKPVTSPAPTPLVPAATPLGATAPPAAPKTEIGLVVGGGLASQQANDKLQAKLGGKFSPPQQALCVVCGQAVYKPEELIVDKAIMHKRCFQCAHCKRLLTMGNFACINGTFYCKVHYFELFSTNGGKYDKAFGDAGFKTKATTSYTPGEVLQPGKMAAKAISPPKVQAAAPVVASPPPVVAMAAAAQSVPVPEKLASPKAAPKKLEIKAPVSNKVVEKTEVVTVPKKNMDDLRKMVVLPGMQPPKPKKEQPPVEEPAEVAKLEEKTEAPASPKAEPVVEEAATETKEDAPVPAMEETPKPEIVAEEAPIQIVRPPVGVNFALEAMKIRQAQLSKAGVVLAPEEPEEPTDVRASVRISGRLDHSAVMSKPRMAGRRAPKVQEVGKLLPKTEIDRMTHDFTFRILVDGSSANVLIVHATSQFEREHWVATLGANVYMLGLKRDLELAQKRDMMSALQAQMSLEAFVNDNKTTYSGFLEKVSMKSQRNWKKRWFVLNDKGELMYFENENAKKPKQTLQLSHLTVIASADGTRLDAPLVISTGASEQTDESGQLPQNIAIFDNEDVTIDLDTIIPENLKAAPEEPAETVTETPATEVATTSGDDFVVVDKAEATPPGTEQNEPVSTPQESVAPAEAEGTLEAPKVDEPKAEEPEGKAEEPVKEETPSAQPVETQVEPEASPVKVEEIGGVALNDESASPSKMSDSGSRRKSGNKTPQKCNIM